MQNIEEIMDGAGCRYKDHEGYCHLTGDRYGDHMEYCEFVDEKRCHYKQLQRSKQENIVNICKINELEVIRKNLHEYIEAMGSKYKQTIADIKDIASAIVNGHHFTDDIESHLKELAKQILVKISEVKK